MTHTSRRHPVRVRYILKDKSERETLIYLTLTVNGKRIKWSTGEKVNPKQWSTKTRRAKVTARNVENQQLNERLDRYGHEALALYQDWQLDSPEALTTFSPDNFKLELEYRLELKPRPQIEPAGGKLDHSDFVRFAETFRDHTKGRPGQAHSTWKKLNNHVNLLREYADLRHGGTIAFAELDELAIDDLKKFLFRTKGHSTQSVHKMMTTLRKIARRAADRDLMDYGYKFKNWTTQKYRKLPKLALSRDELLQFIELDLSKNIRLERVRDLFLIGVATGQRWSDYSKLQRKDFHPLPGGKGYRYRIERQRKTDHTAAGPVMDWALPTLEKYGYIGAAKFDPPKISGQKFNDYLKEVARLALGEATTVTQLDREQKDYAGTIVPKWSVVTSHTARRTAVTLLRSMRVPDAQIMRMTGHKNPIQLTTYDNPEDEHLALEFGPELNAAWRQTKLRAM